MAGTGFILPQSDAADVMTPPTGKFTLFLDQADGYLKEKDDTGTVISLQGDPGPAGQGVPTGGTTGQVLTKDSGTDYDTSWQDPAAGSGDVTGPASSVTGNMAVFADTTGKVIEDGGAPFSGDVGDLTGFPGGTTDFLRADGTFAAPSGGGGLANWVDSLSGSGINATRKVASFTATNAASDVDAVVSPKGEGAFSLQVPDGTTTGGNKRGFRSVDLGLLRGNANQVASGDYSFVAGQNAKSTGTDAVAIGNTAFATGTGATAIGRDVTASGDNSLAMGRDTTATQQSAVAMGRYCDATGQYSTGFGYNSDASASHAHAMGQSCVADGQNSRATGFNSNTRGVNGASAFASGAAGSGSHQRREFILRAATTDATPTVATTDGQSASSSNQINLPSNSAYIVKGTAVARRNNGDVKSWEFRATIKQGSGVATTGIVGTAVVTVADDPGTVGWTLGISADTTNGCLEFDCTGASSQTIAWVIEARSLEYAA